jgi:F-type H+-transporting ATPase subunit gamma
MASLKEVRARIASVTSTRKITSAMRMVSAAKLRRAQDAIASYLPYEQKLNQMLSDLLAFSSGNLSIPLSEKRDIKRVAIVAISSNSSLCGAFNSNIIKKFEETIGKYSTTLNRKDILVYALGKKVADTSRKKGFPSLVDFQQVVDKPDYEQISGLCNELMDMFLKKEIDAVELIYNHFKNAGVQQIRSEKLLPLTPVAGKASAQGDYLLDYILEPNQEELLTRLIPKAVRNKLYSALLDSVAGEFGARTTAMQIATDNAGEMINDLKLKYNKARQEAITRELIDIVGGAESVR